MFIACLTAGLLAEEHPAPPALPLPADVLCVENLPYRVDADADAVRHRADVYLPQQRAGFPTLVFIHGGGYQRGDRTVGHNLGAVLAHHGAAVVSISYRLFPQVRHPGHIQDIARAFAWTRLLVPRLGGDPQRVFVGGHSAGAHLATLLGTDASYLAAEGLSRHAIAGVLAISGGYRINPIRKDVFGDDAALAAASPFAHLTGGHPPFLLLVGGLEKPERHQLTDEFRAGLAAVGTTVTVQVIPERDHQGLLDRVAEGDGVALALAKAMGVQTP